jgi:hypothetical protein
MEETWDILQTQEKSPITKKPTKSHHIDIYLLEQFPNLRFHGQFGQQANSSHNSFTSAL